MPFEDAISNSYDFKNITEIDYKGTDLTELRYVDINGLERPLWPMWENSNWLLKVAEGFVPKFDPTLADVGKEHISLSAHAWGVGVESGGINRPITPYSNNLFTWSDTWQQNAMGSSASFTIFRDDPKIYLNSFTNSHSAGDPYYVPGPSGSWFDDLVVGGYYPTGSEPNILSGGEEFIDANGVKHFRPYGISINPNTGGLDNTGNLKFEYIVWKAPSQYVEMGWYRYRKDSRIYDNIINRRVDSTEVGFSTTDPSVPYWIGSDGRLWDPNGMGVQAGTIGVRWKPYLGIASSTSNAFSNAESLLATYGNAGAWHNGKTLTAYNPFVVGKDEWFDTGGDGHYGYMQWNVAWAMGL